MNFEIEFNKSSPLMGQSPIDFKKVLDISKGESFAVWASLLDTHPLLLNEIVSYGAARGITLTVIKHKTSSGHDVYEVGCTARKAVRAGQHGKGSVDALSSDHHAVFARRICALLSTPEKHEVSLGEGYWQKAASVGIIRYSAIHRQLSSYAMFKRYRHGATEAIRREIKYVCNLDIGDIMYETTPKMEVDHFGLPREEAMNNARSKRYYVNLDRLRETFPYAFDATKRPD